METKVIIYPRKHKAEVFYNGQKYVFNDLEEEDYWNTLGDDSTPECRDINIWFDEQWTVNLYALKRDDDGSLVIDDETCELVENVTVIR